MLRDPLQNVHLALKQLYYWAFPFQAHGRVFYQCPFSQGGAATIGADGRSPAFCSDSRINKCGPPTRQVLKIGLSRTDGNEMLHRAALEKPVGGRRDGGLTRRIPRLFVSPPWITGAGRAVTACVARSLIHDRGGAGRGRRNLKDALNALLGGQGTEGGLLFLGHRPARPSRVGGSRRRVRGNPEATATTVSSLGRPQAGRFGYVYGAAPAL